jgi:lipoic acid synthetase
MVGLGETEGEVAQLLGDVAEAGVSIVTIGQYLRPTRTSIPVVQYVRPEVFERYREVGEAKGLLVQAGPFVRSSFQAGETFAAAEERRGKSFGVELQ